MAIAALLFAVNLASGEDRLPWTTSGIHGSPEPPLAYIPERALHEHTFKNATELDFVPGSSWALVIDQAGRLHGLDRDRPGEVLQLADFAKWNGGNVECYSIVFHPEWDRNRFTYVALLDKMQRPPRSKIVRFSFDPGAPPLVHLDSGKVIIEWESSGHKGGDLHFGPNDGYLYISIGDGEVPAPPDQKRTGQDISDYLASILRIDVDVDGSDETYKIPADNPFVSTPGARPEVWAYGLRNPWKMSFDPRDGALWIGDVGWELWEMVFRIDHAGFNGGWSIVEGPLSVHPDWPKGPTAIEKPVISHSHSESSSITGGMVYRGDRLPELQGAYVYGDWGTGKMWGLWWEDGVIKKHIEVANTPHRLIGFAEDENHELFYMDYADGGVYRLIANPAYNTASSEQGDFPRKLSETGLFSSTSAHELAPGVHGFEIAAPMWNDHATAQHAVAFPNIESATVSGHLIESPAGAAFLRTISMEMEAGKAESSRRIETQLLHFDGIEWRGYSYRWNDDQSDAELVAKDGATTSLEVVDASAPGGHREQDWRFHSRAECVRCHLVEFHKRHGSLNAFTLPQLSSRVGGDGHSELERLIDVGLIDDSARTASSAKLVDPHQLDAPLELRARSYLHANCAHCHKPGSTGAVTMYWPANFDQDRTGAFDIPPGRGDFGIIGARIVSPGRPENATMLYRMLTTGTGRMPAIGSHQVDEAGVTLIADWIRSLAEADPRNESLDDTGSALGKALEAIAMQPEARSALVKEAMQSTNPATRDLFQRFLPPGQRRQVLGAGFDPKSVLALRGDLDRGRELFFSVTGPQCFTCHRIEGKGRELGPDLSNIGSRYSREQLLDQIVHPDAQLEPRWKLHVIEVEGGQTHTGFVTKPEKEKLHFKDTQGADIVIPTDQIRSNGELPTSLMPAGALDQLTASEAADLLEFLLK